MRIKEFIKNLIFDIKYNHFFESKMFLREVFCIHKYEQVETWEDGDLLYQCKKCAKTLVKDKTGKRI